MKNLLISYQAKQRATTEKNLDKGLLRFKIKIQIYLNK